VRRFKPERDDRSTINQQALPDNGDDRAHVGRVGRFDRSIVGLSLSETQSCWQLVSNRAMLLPYARGL
jgi:hypothetical protein